MRQYDSPKPTRQMQSTSIPAQTPPTLAQQQRVKAMAEKLQAQIQKKSKLETSTT
jgi:hypothetical protein